MEEGPDLTVGKKKPVKKVSLAPTTTPQPPPDTPVDALIKDPVAFMKNSMQQEYNEKVAEKVTEAIRRDNTPPAKMLQDLSDAHKLAENISKQAAQPAPAPSVGKAAKKAAAMPSEPTTLDPDAKKMMDAVTLYARYRDTYAPTITDIAWLNDANFARLSLSEMLMRLDLVRRAVNLGSKRGNPVKALFAIAIDAVVKGSLAMAQVGVLDPSYDMTGSMCGGPDLNKKIDEMLKNGDLDNELTQIWVEYADYFNMGPFQRLSLAVVQAASEVQKKNKEGRLQAQPMKTPPANADSKKFKDL